MKATLFSSLSLLTLVACGSAADNTIVEATREQRAKELADRACTQYDKCNDFGSNSDFATRADCVNDYEGKALNLWPADECSNKRINDGKYKVCLNSVEAQACTQNFWDSVSALSDCKASAVCTDPAQ